MNRAEKNSRALVTGGAGFIGSHLVRLLAELKWQVVILDNFDLFYDRRFKEENLKSIREKFSERVMVVEGDVRKTGDVSRVFQGEPFDAVFHLASLAGVRPSLERPSAYFDVNVNGTLNLVEVGKANGMKALIFGSSSSVYGGNLEVPYSEDESLTKPISPYAASKLAAEMICHTYHWNHRIPTVVLRFFTVYGPGQRPDLAIYKFTKNLLRGEPLQLYGEGDSARDYTFVTDIVDGIFRAFEWIKQQKKPGFDVFNLGNSKPVSLKDLVVLLERVTGKKSVIEHLPAQTGDMLVTHANIRKAEQTFGYRPAITIEEGLYKFVQWYRENRTSQ